MNSIFTEKAQDGVIDCKLDQQTMVKGIRFSLALYYE